MDRDQSCWTVVEVQMDGPSGLNSMVVSDGNAMKSMELTVEFRVWWCRVEDCKVIASACKVSGLIKLRVGGLYDLSAMWYSYSYAYLYTVFTINLKNNIVSQDGSLICLGVGFWRYSWSSHVFYGKLPMLCGDPGT